MTPLLKMRIAFAVLVTLPLPVLAILMAWDLSSTYPAKIVNAGSIVATYLLIVGAVWWGIRRFRRRQGAVSVPQTKASRASSRKFLRVIRWAGLVALLDLYILWKFVLNSLHPELRYVLTSGLFMAIPILMVALAARRYRSERLAQSTEIDPS
jgi:hypothetical protein